MPVPEYDRSALTPAVVHLSVGAFHRSHQAVYFDDLARLGNPGWGVVGVGVRRREMKDVLDAQDGLYTVVERSADGDRGRVVGAMCRYLFAPEETPAVLDALADERCRLVTLTLTAVGYETRACAQDVPSSALDLVAAALERRRRHGRPPFTVLSCDNVPGSGELARDALLAHAAPRPGLAAWIDEHVTFPSSMVDRITPGTSDRDRELVRRRFGISDLWPVVTEPFSQWVVEDAFCNGRPPLEEVGVRFVDDVRPYALMKTRLLNASHSAVGYLGSLSGYERIDEAIADPAFGGYHDRMMGGEVAPLLPAVDIDLACYRATLLERFANPAIGDPLERLCRNGSAKVPTHLLSSIREARARRRPHSLLTLAVAAWCRYLRRPGVDDPQGPRLRALALAGGDDPRPLLHDSATFGALGRDPGFAAAVRRDLADLEAQGPRATVAARVGLFEHAAAA